jgi:hypothetical protein
LKWLRLASTSVSLGNNNNGNGPSVVSIELTVPLADERLIAHCLQLQKLLLPGLYQPPESLEQAITQIAIAVTKNTNENMTAREGRS